MDKKISELDQALQINNDAVFPMSQDNAGEPTTFKAGITQLGTEIAEDMTFSNLQTTSKKLVGAINELLSLGSPIIIGTTAPTSSIGTDGNIYVQYTAGIGGADDTVDGIFVKIDGAWCEISTGGGGGTTDYEDLSNKPQVNSVELVGNKTLDDLGIMPASLSKTVSGSIAHFTDGADNIPVKSLVSQIVAVESGSGEKSPENPYTLSGWSNGLLAVTDNTDLQYISGLLKGTYDCADLTSLTWTYNSGNGFLNCTTDLPNAIHSFSGVPNAISGVDLPLINASQLGNVEKGWTIYNRRMYLKNTALSEAELRSLLVGNYVIYKTVSTIQPTVTKSVLDGILTSFGINGNTYTFAFGQTVYGGHFDNKGNLVVTHKFLAFDYQSNWNYESLQGGNFYVACGSDVKGVQTAYNDVKCNCSTWSPVNSARADTCFISSSKYFNFTWGATLGLASVNDFKTYLQTNNLTIQVVCELANPITLAITSQDIPTLLGENNIFSNCGDVEVNYYTDNADEIVEVLKATASTPLHHYSEDEQIIGTWIDGKPLYERVIDLGADTNISYDSWTLTTVSLSEIDRLVLIQGLNSTGAAYYGDLYGGNNNGYLQLLTGRNGTYVSVRYLIFRYTKTST